MIISRSGYILPADHINTWITRLYSTIHFIDCAQYSLVSSSKHDSIVELLNVFRKLFLYVNAVLRFHCFVFVVVAKCYKAEWHIDKGFNK